LKIDNLLGVCEMKTKWIICVIAVILLLQIINSNSGAAVNTSSIDMVRNKPVLNEQDKQIIDKFLEEQINELGKSSTRNLTSSAQTRTLILSKQGTEGLYGNWFSALAKKHIQAGLEKTQTITPQERRDIVVTNFLILIDGLQDLQLTDLVIPRLQSENKVIRYWAVHCLTNPGITRQLNSNLESNLESAKNITKHLKGLLETTRSPEILIQIARFAAEMNIPETVELLIQTADSRIKRYADWTVEQELYDIFILKALDSKVQSAAAASTSLTTGRAAIGRCFAQLYSYAIQRYIKGNDILNNTQKKNLISIMIEIEEKCISRMLGRPQSAIRRAIERNSIPSLIEEHDKLLGSETTAGQLPTALDFNYGTADNGTERTAPLTLPDPPMKQNPGN
jgi:hypothetical protein